jgi:glycosyltransferase involved in cell wall biosynthesis
MRVLYLHPGPVPPPRDPQRDEFSYVPEPLSGDILLPTWARTPEEIVDSVGPNSYPEHRVGHFTYHLELTGRYAYGGMRRKFALIRFYLREGLRLSRKQKFDCILTYGWTLTGLTGLLLARLTGSKLIVAIPNVPENAYRYNRFGNSFDTPSENLATRVMRKASDLMLHFVLLRADCANLFYPDQLKAYPRLANVPAFVIHSFAPISQIEATGASDGSILLVGAPWYVKGVDVLIKAFRMIEGEFAETKLRLIGHYPGQDFGQLIGESRQI